MVEDTLAALKNPNALLENIREPLAAVYQELLALAKVEKAANARNHVRIYIWDIGAAKLRDLGVSSGTRTAVCPVLSSEDLPVSLEK